MWSTDDDRNSQWLVSNDKEPHNSWAQPFQKPFLGTGSAISHKIGWGSPSPQSPVVGSSVNKARGAFGLNTGLGNDVIFLKIQVEGRVPCVQY